LPPAEGEAPKTWDTTPTPLFQTPKATRQIFNDTHSSQPALNTEDDSVAAVCSLETGLEVQQQKHAHNLNLATYPDYYNH